jgi:hypothetical protein
MGEEYVFQNQKSTTLIFCIMGVSISNNWYLVAGASRDETGDIVLCTDT